MFNPMGIDPSKMDPKVLAQLSELVRQLPPEQLNRMQTLMHNAMAGFDVREDMEEFERGLPAEFRAKIASIMIGQPIPAGAATSQPMPKSAPSPEPAKAMDLSNARLTILRGVADGKISPEEAEKLLFN